MKIVDGQFVRSCCFIGNDTYLVIGNYDGTLALFSMKEEDIVRTQTIVEEDQQSNILFAVNSYRTKEKAYNFLTCHEDNIVKRWEMGDMFVLEPQKDYKGHFASVRYACTNLTDTEVLTCCLDHSARIWDDDKMNVKAILHGHTGLCVFGDYIDEKTVVTASWDQTLKLFRLP